METNYGKIDKKDITKTGGSIGQKFSHEAIFMNVSKKSEKISTAIYMVTDLIDVNDPIRHKLRESSIGLISESRSISSNFSGEVYFSIAKVISRSWEIISLIEVACSVGFISDMNARILKTVLLELISSLRDKQKRESFSQIEDLKIGESLSEQISLSKNLFEVEEFEHKRQNTSQDKPIIKDKEMSFIKKEKQSVFIEKPEPKIKESNNTEKPKSSERRSKILDIVGLKGEVVVGDILQSFPDVSSKTIQRELTSMVEENVLKREGEKRWSKYSLNIAN